MKHLLLTTIAAVLVVGCGESQQSAPAPEAKPVEPVAEAATPKPPTAKAPDISIHEAAGSGGNIEAVKQHLAAGTDVNAKDSFGMTPLLLAGAKNQKEVVELLIAEGADVNAKDISGTTTLIYAATNGHKEIVELLRKHGVKPSTINLAVSGGDTQGVKEFLAAGTDVNAKDNIGLTPLHVAASRGHKEIVELLISKGADLKEKYKDGTTPLDEAIVEKHTEIADLLRKHGGKSGAEDSIHIAAKTGNIEAVKKHLAAAVDVNAKIEGGVTPLHYAAQLGHKEIVELLLANGKDVNAAVNGGTPLHRAAYNGHKEIVELLIAEGADVNAKDEVGGTPLHYAGTKEVTELLIAKGADVNAKNDFDQTPLDWAIENNRTETIDLLRKHGGKTKTLTLTSIDGNWGITGISNESYAYQIGRKNEVKGGFVTWEREGVPHPIVEENGTYYLYKGTPYEGTLTPDSISTETLTWNFSGIGTATWTRTITISSREELEAAGK
ncbi:ankyrin repeat domain-containing protein [bacterium]|nr:ankyrin repeat domain-containing protein [bacterium]